MHRILLLTKVMMKSTGNLFFGLTFRKRNQQKVTQKEQKKRSIWLYFLFAILFLFVAISIGMVAYSSLIIAKAPDGNLNWEYIQNLLLLAIPYSFLFMFVFLNSLVISVFFLSSDQQIYLPLPIRPSEIFTARLFTCLFYAYLIELLFIAPMMVSYNLVVHPSFFTYIHETIVFMILPLLPISIIFLYTLLLSKVLHIERHKDAFSILLSILSVLLIIALQMLINFLVPSDGIREEVGAIETFMNQIALYASKMKWFRPIGQFIEAGFISDSWNAVLYSGIFIGASLGFAGMTILLSHYLYQKILLSDPPAKRKKKKENVSKQIKTGHVYFAYLQKEWKTIYRSPTFFIQLLLPPIILVSVFILSFVTLYFTDPNMQNTISTTFTFLRDFLSSQNSGLPLLLIGISFFLCSFFMISATAFSREGKNTSYFKSLPIKNSLQIRAKVTIGIAFECIFLCALAILATIIISLDWYFPFIALAPCILSSVVGNYIMLFMDLKHPYIDWENENAPIKQNKYVAISMLIVGCIGILFAGAGFAFYYLFPASWFLYIEIAGIFFLALSVFLIEFSIHKKETHLLDTI